MRQWRLDTEAEADLARQLDYLASHGAFGAADRLIDTMESFLTDQLCVRPRRRSLQERDLWEVWIPGTKLVLWYRFNDAKLEVVRIWHTSQDRQGSP